MKARVILSYAWMLWCVREVLRLALRATRSSSDLLVRALFRVQVALDRSHGDYYDATH